MLKPNKTKVTSNMDRTLPEGTVANAPVTLDHGATADELASTEALKAYLDKSMPLQSDDERAANEVRVTHTTPSSQPLAGALVDAAGATSHCHCHSLSPLSLTQQHTCPH